LANVDVLWITNGSNGSPPSEVISNVTALADFVFNGGVLSYHDRYVSGGSYDMANLLPGATGIGFHRDISNDADIDILNASTPVTTGLDNTSLDGGTSSSHGYVDAASLPAGAVAILNRGGAPNEIVDFYYAFGAGYVYYSTIPLDYYLAGSGPNPPRDTFTNVYAVNEAGFQASLAANQQPVPEPKVLWLLMLGLIGVAYFKANTALRSRSSVLQT